MTCGLDQDAARTSISSRRRSANRRPFVPTSVRRHAAGDIAAVLLRLAPKRTSALDQSGQIGRRRRSAPRRRAPARRPPATRGARRSRRRASDRIAALPRRIARAQAGPHCRRRRLAQPPRRHARGRGRRRLCDVRRTRSPRQPSALGDHRRSG